MDRYLTQLRNADNPALEALAMAEALARYIADVLEDDPGDEDNESTWVECADAANMLVTALRRLTKGAPR